MQEGKGATSYTQPTKPPTPTPTNKEPDSQDNTPHSTETRHYLLLGSRAPKPCAFKQRAKQKNKERKDLSTAAGQSAPSKHAPTRLTGSTVAGWVQHTNTQRQRLKTETANQATAETLAPPSA